MYKLSAVTKNYQKGRGTVVALRGVDLVVSGGEWLAVQGPTGHGKSTLLQILGGLDRPSSGIVEFDGRDLAQLREAEVTKVRAQSIGFVFQTFNLIPTLSAQENVETALVPLRVSPDTRRQRAVIALEAVGLGDRLRHLPGELSGGQQQRVAIARALVKEPKVLLADEPTGNLDEDTRDEIIGLLETMWRERGLTMVLVTHDSTIARRAQRIAVMKNGRLGFRRPRQALATRSGAARSQAAPAERSGLEAPDLPDLRPSDLSEVESSEHLDLEDREFSEFADFKGTEDPDFEDSEHSGFEDSEHAGFEDSEDPGFEDSEHSGFEDSEHTGFENSEHPGFEDSGRPDLQSSGPSPADTSPSR
jgi:putative ABC transport system ATP-binding protein